MDGAFSFKVISNSYLLEKEINNVTLPITEKSLEMAEVKHREAIAAHSQLVVHRDKFVADRSCPDPAQLRDTG